MRLWLVFSVAFFSSSVIFSGYAGDGPGGGGSAGPGGGGSAGPGSKKRGHEETVVGERLEADAVVLERWGTAVRSKSERFGTMEDLLQRYNIDIDAATVFPAAHLKFGKKFSALELAASWGYEKKVEFLLNSKARVSPGFLHDRFFFFGKQYALPEDIVARHERIFLLLAKHSYRSELDGRLVDEINKKFPDVVFAEDIVFDAGGARGGGSNTAHKKRK